MAPTLQPSSPRPRYNTATPAIFSQHRVLLLCHVRIMYACPRGHCPACGGRASSGDPWRPCARSGGNPNPTVAGGTPNPTVAGGGVSCVSPTCPLAGAGGYCRPPKAHGSAVGFGTASYPPGSGGWGSASPLDHVPVAVTGGGACWPPGISQPSNEFSLEVVEPTARPSGGLAAPKSGPDVALERPTLPPDHCCGWRYCWAGACPPGCAADQPSPSTLSPLTHGGPKVGLFCKLVLGTRRPTGKSTGAVPALCLSSVIGDPRC